MHLQARQRSTKIAATVAISNRETMHMNSGIAFFWWLAIVTIQHGNSYTVNHCAWAGTVPHIGHHAMRYLWILLPCVGNFVELWPAVSIGCWFVVWWLREGSQVSEAADLFYGFPSHSAHNLLDTISNVYSVECGDHRSTCEEQRKWHMNLFG